MACTRPASRRWRRASLGTVYVVAPGREVSACAQSLTLKHPLRVERVDERVHAVDGTPADCVNLALVKLLPRRPDLVVSGINRGANMGEDVFYSGTVGGAREGTFFGVPSSAFSLAVREAKDLDFAPAAAFAAKLAALVLSKGLPERTLLNVNVPPGAPVAVAVTVQGRREHEGRFRGLDQPAHVLLIEEGRDHWISDEMSDTTPCAAASSVSPCSPTRRTMPCKALSVGGSAGRAERASEEEARRKHVPEARGHRPAREAALL